MTEGDAIKMLDGNGEKNKLIWRFFLFLFLSFFQFGEKLRSKMMKKGSKPPKKAH